MRNPKVAPGDDAEGREPSKQGQRMFKGTEALPCQSLQQNNLVNTSTWQCLTPTVQVVVLHLLLCDLGK